MRSAMNGMTAEGRRARAQHKLMRLLTLVCFFHFTGLNNGFTYLVVSQGQIEGFAFAPVVIEKAAAVLNPVNWKHYVLDGLCRKWFSKSGEIARYASQVQYASRNVIVNILTESSLLEMWMSDSLARKARFAAPNAPHFEGGKDAARAGNSAGGEAVLSGISREEAALAQNSGRRALEESTNYLEIDAHRAWLDALQSFFKKGDKYGQRHLERDDGSSHPALRHKVELSWAMLSARGDPPDRAFVPGSFFKFLHGSERGEDDPALRTILGRYSMKSLATRRVIFLLPGARA